ncbi:MAG: tetratricopeptide repeat protein [Bacteroidetes bacterium]|nr:tetratricopeptide repeat protein [Bacteroidota bacterium]
MLIARRSKKLIILSVFAIACIAFTISCSNEQPKTENKNINSKIVLSPDIDELLKDTTKVTPIVDSLKKEFFVSNDSMRLDILAQLSENWRAFSLPLAQELLSQSKKNQSTYTEALAYCKFGIYYYRAYKIDSANYFLEKASSIGVSKNLKAIQSESIAWQGEVQRRLGNKDTAIILQKNAQEIARTIKNKKIEAFSLMAQGEAYRDLFEFDKAFECYNKCITIAQEIGDTYKIIICYNSIGDINRVKGNYVKALEYFNKSMNLAKSTGNKRPLAYSLNTLGDIYSAQKEFSKALKFYEEAIKIANEIEDKLRVSNLYNSMGLTHELLKNKDMAIEFYNRSIKISEEIGNTDNIALSYSRIGSMKYDDKKVNEAIEYFQKAYKLSEETGNAGQMCDDLRDMGQCYFDIKDYNKAKNVAEKSLAIAQETELLENIKTSAFLLYKINSELNNPNQALKMLSLFIESKDSLSNEEQVKKFAAVEYEAKEEGLKAEQEAKEKTYKAERAREEEELKRQKTIRYAFTIGFVLVLVLVVVVYRNLRENKKKNAIILEQKKEVEHAKELVEEKHKEITDSINYAERIQRTFLATEESLNNNLKDYFIYFQPKDVVSGDFYWSYKLADGNFLMATADSTGHGVPGSIMSLLNITSLEKACEHYTEPADILNHTRATIIERLKKDGSAEGGKDGMDCSLISFNFSNNTIKYSTANNPIWIAQENGTKLLELKPDKMPVGKHDKDKEPFTQNTVQLNKGDVVYSLTDGLPDQFGGTTGKKFMSKRLKELLLSISQEPMKEQGEKIKVILNEWKGNLEQVDDITLIGVRI